MSFGYFVHQFELVAGLTTGWEPGDGAHCFWSAIPCSLSSFREADVGLFLKARQEGHRPACNSSR